MNKAMAVNGGSAVAATTFDVSSAQPLKVRIELSNHYFYKDAAGSICLTVVGRFEGGKVAIRDLADKMLRELPGAHFIRVIDRDGAMDKIASSHKVLLDCAVRLARMPEDAQDLI